MVSPRGHNLKSLVVASKIKSLASKPTRRHGGHIGAMPLPKWLLVPPKRKLCPPKRGLCPEKINRLGATGVLIEAQIGGLHDIFGMKTFFFFGDHLFSAGKTAWISDFGRKILWIFAPHHVHLNQTGINFSCPRASLEFTQNKVLVPPQNLFLPPSHAILAPGLPRSLQFHKKALSSDRGQHYFSICWKWAKVMTILVFRLGIRQTPRGNFMKTFFSEKAWIFAEILQLFSAKTFFLENTCALCPWHLTSSISVFGLERVCPRKGGSWPWPWNFFVSLVSSLASSTPPLMSLSFFPECFKLLYIS